MGLTTTTTIFLFIVCLCGGIVIGAMFGRLKKSPPEQGDKTPAVEPQDEMPPAPPPPAPKTEFPGDTVLLRLGRDKTDKLWLEMGGKRLEGKEDLRPDQMKELQRTVVDLRPWLDVAPSPATRTVTAVTPENLPPPEPLQPTRRPSIFSLRPPKAAKPAADDRPPVNLKSIVLQIDDVLQTKLIGTPLEKLDIHLLEGPGGEVEIQIGSLKHAGVDAIPNPEIQAIIRQAIIDWEKSATR